MLYDLHNIVESVLYLRGKILVFPKTPWKIFLHLLETPHSQLGLVLSVLVWDAKVG